MSAQKSAFVLGATGAVGRRLVEVLNSSRHFSRVVLLGRRTIELPEELKDIEQRVVDFEKLEEYKKEFEGFDVGFCALGTTRGKAGAECFYRVDHDYVLESAKLAKEAGTETFCLVTATNADAESRMLYSRTKGEVERDVTSLSFSRLIIARPAFLEGPREEFRLVECVAKVFIQPLKLFSNSIAIQTADVAKALVASSLDNNTDKVRTLSNSELIELAKNYDTAQ